MDWSWLIQDASAHSLFRRTLNHYFYPSCIGIDIEFSPFELFFAGRGFLFMVSTTGYLPKKASCLRLINSPRRWVRVGYCIVSIRTEFITKVGFRVLHSINHDYGRHRFLGLCSSGVGRFFLALVSYKDSVPIVEYPRVWFSSHMIMKSRRRFPTSLSIVPIFSTSPRKVWNVSEINYSTLFSIETKRSSSWVFRSLIVRVCSEVVALSKALWTGAPVLLGGASIIEPSLDRLLGAREPLGMDPCVDLNLVTGKPGHVGSTIWFGDFYTP